MAPIGMEPATSPGSLRGFCLSAERNGGAVFIRPLGILGHADGGGRGRSGHRPLAGRRTAGLRDGGGDRPPCRTGVSPARPVLWPKSRTGHRPQVARCALPASPALRRPCPATSRRSWGSSTSPPTASATAATSSIHANAIAQGTALLDAGADILDVGGEFDAPRRRSGLPGGGNPPRRSGRAALRRTSAPWCRSTPATPPSWRRRWRRVPPSSTTSPA